MSKQPDIPHLRLVPAAPDAEDRPLPVRRKPAAPRLSVVARHADAPPTTHARTSGSNNGRARPARQDAAGLQLSLFSEVATCGPSLLGFFYITRASGSTFKALCAQIRPVWMHDLRPVPWFSIDRLDRMTAFAVFDQHDIVYCDLAGQFELDGRHDPRLASGDVSERLNRLMIEEYYPGMKGPIIFLVDDPDVLATAVDVFPRTLEPRPKGGWVTHIFDPRSDRHV